VITGTARPPLGACTAARWQIMISSSVTGSSVNLRIARGVMIAKYYLGAVGAAGYVRAARQAIEQSEEITLAVTPERVLTPDFAPETPWFGKVWLVLKRALPPQL
jgi:hypothetical protein